MLMPSASLVLLGLCVHVLPVLILARHSVFNPDVDSKGGAINLSRYSANNRPIR